VCGRWPATPADKVDHCGRQVYRRECMVQELILELDVKWMGKQKFQLQARAPASFSLVHGMRRVG